MSKYTPLRKLLEMLKIADPGLVGGTAAAAMLAGNNEAEAAPIIPRKTLENITKEATQEGVLNFSKLLDLMEIKKDSNKVQKLSELLGHTALERTGLPETEIDTASKIIYPEFTGEYSLPITESKELPYGVKGQAHTPASGQYPFFGQLLGQLPTITTVNPKGSKILLSSDLSKEPIKKTGVLLHELQHIKDKILSPYTANPEYRFNKIFGGNYISLSPEERIYYRDLLNKYPDLLKELVEKINKNAIKNASDTLSIRRENALGTTSKIYGTMAEEIKDLEKYKANRQISEEELLDTFKELPKDFNDSAVDLSVLNNFKNYSPEDTIGQYSKFHHTQYPYNYELEKTKELIEKGISTDPKEVALKRMKMDELEKEYLSKAINTGKKSIPLATGLGAYLFSGNAEAKPDMNPLPAISEAIQMYRKVQEPVADYVTETVSKPFGGADETTKLLNRILLDPTNIGALGGLMQALEFALPKDKKENQ